MTAGHLEVIELTKAFAGLTAVDAVDVEVRPGEIVGLIGPNGAGKTTLFNCITGFLARTRGRVIFDDEDVTDLTPPARAARGMVRTFQQVRLFAHLSVRENLLLGRHLAYGANAAQAMVRTRAAQRAERAAREHIDAIAVRMGLTDVLDARVGDLPYGTQRMVEVGRAIATEPRILLLDEPSAGMDTSESAQFGELLKQQQRDVGCSMLLIEHDVALVMAVCTRIYVLDFGRLIAEGSPGEIARDARVRAAYFGAEAVGARG
jgi:branched-chain amino acid transport system ATP-binding protein